MGDQHTPAQELARKLKATEGFYEIKDRRRTTGEVHALADYALALAADLAAALAREAELREALGLEGKTWLAASRTWTHIERTLSNTGGRLDALSDAARRTSHGDHDYDVDVLRTDCLLCAAIEDRYQPPWMEEPHEWIRDPTVKVVIR